MDGAAVMLLLELTTLSCAPLVDTPPRPPVIVMPVLAATVATLTPDVVVSAVCFAAREFNTFVPATVSVPLIVAFPATVSVEFSTAALSACNSRVAITSRPWMFAVHVTLAIESCVVELIDAPAFAAIVVIMSTPAT